VAAKGYKTILMLLFNIGKVDLEIKDDYGWMAPLWAAASGRETVLKLLLDVGADIKLRDSSGRMMLWWAVLKASERGRLNIIE
jgi:ankyrin repeat protein